MHIRIMHRPSAKRQCSCRKVSTNNSQENGTLDPLAYTFSGGSVLSPAIHIRFRLLKDSHSRHPSWCPNLIPSLPYSHGSRRTARKGGKRGRKKAASSVSYGMDVNRFILREYGHGKFSFDPPIISPHTKCFRKRSGFRPGFQNGGPCRRVSA
jgi:hypothetical protein